VNDRLAPVLACFFLSGFAALLYQTAWTRELSFVFGTSELAVAAVLAAYMGGLALGAAVAARFALRLRRPVLVYGVLELAIAVSALLVPFGIRLINAGYVALLGGGDSLPDEGVSVAVGFQLLAAFAVLLPPTAFMGATLPLLARHAVRSEAEIGSRVGLLYAVNTAGAIGGTLVAAFWLLPELGLRRTVWVGAALNGVVFGLAAWLSRGAVSVRAAGPTTAAASRTVTAARWILPAIALSGAVSFTYEVLWTRLLGHLLGASVQAFASMLASFLLGITLGSAAAARLARSPDRAAVGFCFAQLGIALTAYAAMAIAGDLPSLAAALGAGLDAPLANAAVAVVPLLPITLCIGATFPFAVRVLALHAEEAAAATARVYAWNTVGAIVGALGAGFVLLPRLGFEGTLAVGVTANLVLAAATALAVRPRRTALALVAAAAGVALVALPPRPPWTLLRTSPLSGQQERGEILYAAVGRSSTVMLFDQGTSYRLSSNGLPESMIDAEGSLLQASVARWLGLLPSLLRPGVRELLVVGLGGGMAIEPVPSTVETIDVIELEPEVLTANQIIAGKRAIDPLADPRVRVFIGDARGALQLTDKRYDAIVSQPSHPWTAGASHLYTKEFFTVAHSHLAPDGVFVQWIGISFVDEALLRSLVASLLEVFGHCEVYRPQPLGLLFVASDAPLGLGGVAESLRSARHDYARFGFHRLEDVAAARVLDAAGARALAQGAMLTTDDHNLMASRAARLGARALTPESLHALLIDLDPLQRAGDALDYPSLVRTLAGRGFGKRATALSLSRQGAAQEIGLGWTELAMARPQRAGRHFDRALELAPDHPDALVGLAASGRILEPGGKLRGELAAVVSAGKLANDDDWDAVAALDPELARVQPGTGLFERASRLRIRWRMASREPGRAAEALTIADAMLSRRWRAQDALMRASAAIQAGRLDVARATLGRIADLPQQQGTPALCRHALEIARALPGETDHELRRRLARRAAAAPQPSPGFN